MKKILIDYLDTECEKVNAEHIERIKNMIMQDLHGKIQQVTGVNDDGNSLLDENEEYKSYEDENFNLDDFITQNKIAVGGNGNKKECCTFLHHFSFHSRSLSLLYGLLINMDLLQTAKKESTPRIPTPV